MTLKVLQTSVEIDTARIQLKKLHVSFTDNTLNKIFRKLGIIKAPRIGDRLKSWDILSTINFIQAISSNKGIPILDIGCYASELILALSKLGFTNIKGIDLNPAIKDMPYKNKIEYTLGNFMETKFPDKSFEIITAISVIEHGFNSTALLKEISRILKQDGYFISSFDYWKDKIDTSNKKMFDMDWKIFSANDIQLFISEAESFGLEPIGKISFMTSTKPITCEGENYTFAWLVLRKIF